MLELPEKRRWVGAWGEPPTCPTNPMSAGDPVLVRWKSSRGGLCRPHCAQMGGQLQSQAWQPRGATSHRSLVRQGGAQSRPQARSHPDTKPWGSSLGASRAPNPHGQGTHTHTQRNPLAKPPQPPSSHASCMGMQRRCRIRRLVLIRLMLLKIIIITPPNVHI